MKNNKRTQGFTLIELLIVIAIIGILAAVLIPNLLGAQKRAYDTGAQSCAKSLQTAQAVYQIDKQNYFPVTKAIGATALTFGNDGNGVAVTAVDGISAGCLNSNIQITNVAPSGANATYQITVNDQRGSKSYIATPSSLTGS